MLLRGSISSQVGRRVVLFPAGFNFTKLLIHPVDVKVDKFTSGDGSLPMNLTHGCPEFTPRLDRIGGGTSLSALCGLVQETPICRNSYLK